MDQIESEGKDGGFALTRSSSSRRSLHRRVPSLSNHQVTPISKHYEVNNQILHAFQSNYEQKIYQVAYALGLQFVETALLEIPKHGYFYSRRHERERMQSALDAVRVSQLLQEIQDAAKVPVDPKRMDALQALALEQVQQASQDQTYESHRAETERLLRSSEMEEKEEWVVCEPLLACADNLSEMFSSYPSSKVKANRDAKAIGSATVRSRLDNKQQREPQTSQRQLGAVPDVAVRPEVTTTSMPPPLSPAPAFDRSHTAPAWAPEQWDWKRNRSGGSASNSTRASPRRMLPRPPPFAEDELPQVSVKLNGGSNDSVLLSNGYYDEEYTTLARKVSSEDQLERALYLSGLVSSRADVPSDEEEDRVPPPSSTTQEQRLELNFLSNLYREDFESLCKVGQIRINFVPTYQGRLAESTNGCTVIAPLLCIHHLLESQVPDPGLPDTVIVHVIDHETPAILSDLRRALGLADQAFLIPSDAHDCFIKNGQLSQDQFVTVVGGNILDDSHLTAFIDTFRNTRRKKVAATLFFHEHVIAILQVKQSKRENWYDIVDSLPLKKTFMRSDENEADFHFRLGVSESKEEITEAFLPMTSRTRCLDEESLATALRWYACSKFSEENISYIDQYPWDEASCDFDPRVFQGFVWSESPQD